jgi:unsaturated chondroitin disaccharide hydrolase
MKSIITIISAFLAIGLTGLPTNTEQLISENFHIAEKQYEKILAVSTDIKKYPRTANPQGELKYTGIEDWTGGFWPGMLWYMYEYTQKKEWKAAAERWTNSLEQNQYNASHHDIGFMMYCSYGNGYRLTGNKKYRDILIQSAKTLCARYDEKTGCIKSWNSKLSWDGKTRFNYPVIIDNMMNLELLFFASKETKNPSYRKIAISHAEQTMKNHIRQDYSTYHVVNYDPVSGKVLHRETNQGFSDNSTWSRGQAWAIYGFTTTYRETKDKRFLNTAIKLADFYLNHKALPEDKIPLWDFNVNEEGFVPQWNAKNRSLKPIPRDASAAALVSSALLELSTYIKGSKKQAYQNAAKKIIVSLSSDTYRVNKEQPASFLLKHSTGSFPHGSEVDAPLVYADYYFIEALLRLQQQSKTDI